MHRDYKDNSYMDFVLGANGYWKPVDSEMGNKRYMKAIEDSKTFLLEIRRDILIQKR